MKNDPEMNLNQQLGNFGQTRVNVHFPSEQAMTQMSRYPQAQPRLTVMTLFIQAIQYLANLQSSRKVGYRSQKLEPSRLQPRNRLFKIQVLAALLYENFNSCNTSQNSVAYNCTGILDLGLCQDAMEIQPRLTTTYKKCVSSACYVKTNSCVISPNHRSAV